MEDWNTRIWTRRSQNGINGTGSGGAPAVDNNGHQGVKGVPIVGGDGGSGLIILKITLLDVH